MVRSGPYVCHICAAFGEDSTRMGKDQMLAHVETQHDILLPKYGRDYESQAEVLKREADEEARIGRLCDFEVEQARPAIDRVNTVEDFLRECGARG